MYLGLDQPISTSRSFPTTTRKRGRNISNGWIQGVTANSGAAAPEGQLCQDISNNQRRGGQLSEAGLQPPPGPQIQRQSRCPGHYHQIRTIRLESRN